MAIDHDEEYRKIYGFYPPKNPNYRYELSRVLSGEDGMLILHRTGCDGSRIFEELPPGNYNGAVDIFFDGGEFYDEDGLEVKGLAEWAGIDG
jgi:hypothetical protein